MHQCLHADTMMEDRPVMIMCLGLVEEECRVYLTVHSRGICFLTFYFLGSLSCEYAGGLIGPRAWVFKNHVNEVYLESTRDYLLVFIRYKHI